MQMVCSRLVMPQDMNPANRLFGGQMMKWVDEAAALYVMTRTKLTGIVTISVSGLTFLEPVESGDILQFECNINDVGTTSLEVYVVVNKLNPRQDMKKTIALSCYVKFVNTRNGKSFPHGIDENDLN